MEGVLCVVGHAPISRRPRTCFAAAGGPALAQALEALRAAAAEAVQLHGGIGFTWEHEAHLYFKRAASDELLFGPVHRLRGNLPAHPEEAVVGWKGRDSPVRFRLLEGAERAAVWQAALGFWPPYAAYQARIERGIRLFRLERREVR